jgi:hypothetical protein
LKYKKREEKENGEVVRDDTFERGARNCIFDFEGSQAVPPPLLVKVMHMIGIFFI